MRPVPPRGFDEEEYRARLARAQQLMQRSSLDALLLTTEANVRYFSGFLTRFWVSPTRPWFLVVPASGKPIAVIPEIGEPLMSKTWIEDIRTWPSPSPDDDGVGLVADTLAGAGRVGLPMGPETSLRMPLRDFSRLQSRLAAVEFADASDLMAALRMVKSPSEVAKIAYICSVASEAFAAVGSLVDAGRSLADIFRRFKIELLERGADDVPYLVGASAPGGYSDVISPPNDHPLRPGDILMMDTGAVHDGYFCDFDRNYAVGMADDVSRKAYDTLYHATEAGFEAARPGATCADLYRVMRGVISSEGFEDANVGRFGHGLGMQLTERPSVVSSDRTMLEPGMVLTLEPGLQIGPGRSMVHEENIVITGTGAEMLSRRAAPEMPVVSL